MEVKEEVKGTIVWDAVFTATVFSDASSIVLLTSKAERPINSF